MSPKAIARRRVAGQAKLRGWLLGQEEGTSNETRGIRVEGIQNILQDQGTFQVVSYCEWCSADATKAKLQEGDFELGLGFCSRKEAIGNAMIFAIFLWASDSTAG